MTGSSAIAAALSLLATPAMALTLNFPRQAEATLDRILPLSSAVLAIAPYGEDGMETLTVEGVLQKQAFRVPNAALTTLQILAPLRAQIEASGFDILFECETEGCGGFDFRFALDTLREPEMHVDLGDFRYLAAQRVSDGPAEAVSLLVSRSGSAGFIEVTRVGAAAVDLSVAGTTALPPIDTATALGLPLKDRLRQIGRATLQDLTFRTGSSELDENRYPTLESLAEYLAENRETRVVLVGHTDAVGALDGNISLSRDRAQSVVDRLIAEYGVSPAQISAEGVGFLAPVASNLSPDGRLRNRRVEAIVTSTK